MPTLPLIVTPDPDEPRALEIRLDVGLAGETVRAVVDTGGGSSTFATTSRTGDLAVLGPATGRGVTGAVAPDDLVVLPSLALGPIELREIHANRMPPGDKRPPSIGMDVIGRYRWHFRFRSRAVDIDEMTPPDVSPAPLTTLPGGQPVVPIRIGGHEAAGFWDTGAGLTVVDETFAKNHPDLFETAGVTDGIDSSGSGFVAAMATMAPCEIGGVQFEATPCAIFDLSAVNDALKTPINLGIGAPLIVLNDWLFDFPAGSWAVTPATDNSRGTITE